MRVVNILPEAITFRYEDVTSIGELPRRLLIESFICGKGMLEDQRSAVQIQVSMTSQELAVAARLVEAVTARVLAGNAV